jgi:hypothetical protein
VARARIEPTPRPLSARLSRSPSWAIQLPMDHDTLDRLRQGHPAWRILVADNAPLVLSFLNLAFIQPIAARFPARKSLHTSTPISTICVKRTLSAIRVPHATISKTGLHLIARICASTIRGPGPTPSLTSRRPRRKPSSGYRRWHHNNSSEPSHVS